jgi:hypothetical protein
MTPQEFYANVGDRFGIVGGDRVNPHRGVDFPWGQGTPIPSWCAGTVVRNEWNSVIGWIMTVETSGGWAGFCHMASQSPLPVGSTVSFGQTIGLVGNTGSASRGAHLHATFSTAGNHPGTSPVVDPLPWITANLSATAGGGTSPFPKPQRLDHDMELYAANAPAEIPQKYLGRNKGLTGGKPTYFLIPSGAIPRVTQDQNLASQWSQQLFGQSSSTGIVPVSWGWADQLYDEAVAALTTVAVGDVTVDNTEVIKRLDALPAAIAIAFFAEQKKAGN